MAATIGNLAIKISAGTSQLKQDLLAGANLVASFASKANGALKDAFTGAQGILTRTLTGGDPFKMMYSSAQNLIGAIPKVGGFLVATMDLVSATKDKIIGLKKEAIKLGTDMETISALRYAAKSDEAMETLVKGLGKLQAKLGDAKTGGKEAQKQFESLGLNWEKMSKMNLADKVDSLAKRFKEIKDPNERAYFSMQLFGKGGAEMIPILDKLSRGLKLNSEEAKKLGLSWTEMQAAAAKASRKGLKELQERVEGKTGAFASWLMKQNDAFDRGMESISTKKRVYRPSLPVEPSNADSQENARMKVEMQEKFAAVLKGMESPMEKYLAAEVEINRALELGSITLAEKTTLIAAESKAMEAAQKSAFDSIGVSLAKTDPLDVYWEKFHRLKDAAKENEYAAKHFDDAIRQLDKDLLKSLGMEHIDNPFEKWEKSLANIRQYDLFIGKGAGRSMNETAGKALVKDLGLDRKETAYDKYLSVQEKVNAMRAAGNVHEALLTEILERNTLEFLKQANIQAAERAAPPEALARGSAASFSAINAFQRSGGGSKEVSVKDAIEAASKAAQKAKDQEVRELAEIKDLIRRQGQPKVIGQ